MSTGGTSNIATFGGTGTLTNGTNLTSSIGTTPVLLPGGMGFLHLNDTGLGSGQQGVKLIPSSAAHSPDSWFATGSSFITINGAVDFFFRDSNNSSGWGVTGGEFRPIDIDGGNSGLRFIINSFSTDRMQAELVAKNGSGGAVADIRACPNVHYPVAANTLYHVAVTVSTNPTTGIVTVSIWQVPGNATINSASTAYLLATASSTTSISSSVVTHAFNTASGFTFGQVNNPSDTKTLDFGSLRFYNAVPAAFNAVTYLPAPAVATPSANPALPAAFDVYAPPVTTNAPAANTPAMAEWTVTGNPGDGVVISGNGFSTYASTSANFGKDTSFVSFGQTGSAVLAPDAPAPIRRLSTDGASAAAIEVNPTLPAQSMYLIWPVNANGAGTPIVVNQAEAWWLGPNIASTSTATFATGQPVSLFGRNLYLPGSSLVPQIWIQASGAMSGTMVTPTAYSPYKLDFTVPGGLSNGTPYQVWVHNGHGGAYGWSLCPQPLVLSAPIPWTGTQFNVTSYGAVGNGVHDDAAAINSAMAAAAASPYSTLYFPAGTYLVKSSLNYAPANVQWLGVGNTSHLVAGANNVYLLRLNSSSTNVWASNLELDGGASTVTGSYLLNGLVPNGTGQSDHFTNLTLVCAGNSSQGEMYLANPQNTFFENCTFTGGGSTPVGGTQLFFDHCTFNMMWDGVGLNVKEGLTGFAVTNCTCQNAGTWLPGNATSNTVATSTSSSTITLADSTNFNVGYTVVGPGLPSGDTITAVAGSNVVLSANPTTAEPIGSRWFAAVPPTSGVGIGLFVKGNNDGGARTNLYYGGNTTIGIADENPADNWGEQTGFEGNFGFYYGTPEAGTVTSTSMTFDPATMTAQGFVSTGTIATQLGNISYGNLTGFNGLMAVIIKGTGLGQSRLVSSYSLSSGNVTVATPWTLPPDTTSTIALGWYVRNVAIYGNNQSGQVLETAPNVADTESHGIEIFGGVNELICDTNTYTDFSSGILDVPMGERDEPAGTLPAAHISPTFFHLIANNTVNSSRTGILESPSGAAADSIAATYGFAHIIRNNTISNSTVEGIEFDTPTQPTVGGPPNFDMFLADDNTITGCPAAFVYSDFTGPAGWFNASQLGNTILTGNSMTFAGASNPGTVREGTPFGSGIYWQNRVSPYTALNDNVYSGYSSPYSSSALGPILEEPLRSFTENASLTLTSSVTDSLILWNDGVSSASWTVTATCDTGSGWLSASPTSGSIANESSTSTVNFTCNGASLTAGTYTGHITATCGSITRTAQVTFVVGP